MQYYDALGLAPKLSLNADDLKKRFYERSREWHPDRFARRGAEEQKKALNTTALLNDAFRTLRDPISRAEYFLEEHKLPPTKTPPPELLEEVFELNMALEELREGDESARAQLVEAEKRFVNMRAEIDGELAGMFARYDVADEAGNHPENKAAALAEIRAALDRRRYISNLVRDVEKELRGGEKELNVQLSN